MTKQEKDLILKYFNGLQPKNRSKELKKIEKKYKSNVRQKTKKYMQDNNITFDKCVICGEDFCIEIHHLDYERPYVISPLCLKHHSQQHSKNKQKIPFINLETREWFYE